MKRYRLLIISILYVMFSQTVNAFTPTSFSPADGSTDISGDSDFQITFASNACSNAMGGFTIKDSGGTTIYSATYLSTGEITGWNSTTITFNPYVTLAKNTDYYMNITSSMIRNCSGMPPDFYNGINDSSTWNFSVGSDGACSNDFDSPCLTPTDSSTNVNPYTNLVINFHRPVEAYNQYSTMSIKKFSDNSVVETINLYNGSNVTINSNIVTINPNSTLELNTHYYITINGFGLVATTDNSKIFVGINNNSTWDFTTDNIDPNCNAAGIPGYCCNWTCASNFGKIVDPGFTPLDNATSVSLTANLTLLFNGVLMHRGSSSSYFTIKRSADDSSFESFPMNSSKITFENGDFMGDARLDTRITINPTNGFAASTAYYIDIDCDALEDVNGDDFGIDASSNLFGASGKTIWNFTTGAGGGDSTPPSVTSFSPADDATGVSVLTNLSILFDEAVDLQTGNLVIKRSSNNATIETISVGSAQVTGNGGTTIAFDTSVTLLNGTAYYVQINGTAIDDLAGNSYAGISDTTTWDFTTAGTADTTAPTVLHYSPANGAVMIARYQGLNLIFSEPVIKGSGTIYAKRYSDDVTIYSVSVASSDVVVNGTSFTIKGQSLLNAGSRFYVELPSGVVEDAYGNDFAGISNKDTWNFNTNQDQSLYTSF